MSGLSCINHEHPLKPALDSMVIGHNRPPREPLLKQRAKLRAEKCVVQCVVVDYVFGGTCHGYPAVLPSLSRNGSARGGSVLFLRAMQAWKP